MRSLAHRVGNQPINADGCKDQREKGEAAQHGHEKLVSAPLTFDGSWHAHPASQWKFGVHLCDCAAQRRGEAIGIGTCANNKRERIYGALKERLVDFRFDASVFGIGFYVAGKSDNLAPLRRCAAHIQADLFSERVLVLQMTMYKFLVYHHYPRRRGVVRLRERPAAQ